MNEEIFKIRKDKERAKEILKLAKDRFELIEIYPKSKTYKIVEEYYEAIKGLIVSSMYKNGFKTLSHKSLINWLENKYSTITDREIELLDNLRKLRNGSLYYGEKINKLFLENNKDKIENLFKKLLKLIE
jgi:hypothetical protein